MLNNVLWIVLAVVALPLCCALLFFRSMLKQDAGSADMQRIGALVHAGAMTYLGQQYRVMALAFVVLAALFALLAFAFGLQSRWLPLTFVTGGISSALAGYIGMQTATRASTRTAAAARTSLPAALRVAFRSGAVMGLSVVGLGLGNIVVWLLILNAATDGDVDAGPRMLMITTTLLTFSMGASLQALFARVGGGIYTKAADVCADLVGKVEAGIPEDDPRNPAVIADNVGDNVGDVAGMGADLFESFCGSILAACALGASTWLYEPQLQQSAVLAPLVIAALGVTLSIVGVFLVRTREDADDGELLAALSRGVNTSAAGIVVLSAPALYWLGTPNWIGTWCAVVVGLVTGIVIGRATEYATSSSSPPTRFIAKQALDGPATIVIAGIGTGMLSTTVPVLAVCVGTLGAFLAGAGLDPGRLGEGLYGVAIAAVGMLSTLAITLASDAYGPIADNAGGNAEMSNLGPEVRARTDRLDALGNTTAATGKGFAIGSAALTSLALIASFLEVVRGGLADGGTNLPLSGAGIDDLLLHFNITLLNPAVLVGLFVGAMAAFVFSGLTIQAVGRAAGLMVDEVRRQFREDPGILKGTSLPDYDSCIAISTRAAQRELLVPSLIGVATPVALNLLLGVAGVVGLLTGALATGFVLAVFLSNAGGAFDNAKKYIEAGHFGGKNSLAHRAAVIGDTLGDPFKDTAGPSLNILIKLMSIVAVVIGGTGMSFSLL